MPIGNEYNGALEIWHKIIQFQAIIPYAADVVYTTPKAPASDEASIGGGGYIGANRI